jgi:hypothetical protein
VYWQCEQAIICRVQAKYLFYKWLWMKYETWGHHFLHGSFTLGGGGGGRLFNTAATTVSQFDHSLPWQYNSTLYRHLPGTSFESRLALACSDGPGLNVFTLLSANFGPLIKGGRADSSQYRVELNRLQSTLQSLSSCYSVFKQWELRITWAELLSEQLKWIKCRTMD